MKLHEAIARVKNLSGERGIAAEFTAETEYLGEMEFYISNEPGFPTSVIYGEFIDDMRYKTINEVCKVYGITPETEFSCTGVFHDIFFFTSGEELPEPAPGVKAPAYVTPEEMKAYFDALEAKDAADKAAYKAATGIDDPDGWEAHKWVWEQKNEAEKRLVYATGTCVLDIEPDARALN